MSLDGPRCSEMFLDDPRCFAFLHSQKLFISRGRTTPMRNDTRAQSCAEILHIVWPWDIGKTRGALRKPDRAEKTLKTLKTETESWWEHLGHSLVRTGCDTNLNAQSSTLRSVGIEMYLYYQVICEPNKRIMNSNKKTLYNISYWNQNGQKHAAEQVNLNHIQFYSNSRPLNI